MQDVKQALNQVKELYREVLGQPAPEVPPPAYVSFPPGVDPQHHAVEEVEQLRRWSEQMKSAPKPAAWVPVADTFTGKSGLLIQLEVPGVRREDLKVFFTANECVVRGERTAGHPGEDLRPLTVERPWGHFERRFALPVGVAADKIKARYADGVLELRIQDDGPTVADELSVEIE